MTSTPCQSAALGRIIAPCMATIAVFLHAIVETILTIMPKLKAMGRHARLLRHRTGFLPPSASTLHAAVGAAPARITDNRKVALDVSLSAQMREAWQASSPQVCWIGAGEEQTMPRECSWTSKSLRLTIQEASGKSVLT